MNFFESKQLLQDRLDNLLEKENLNSVFTSSFLRMKNITKGGSFNLEDKQIKINIDRLFLHYKTKDVHGNDLYFYTIFPLTNVTQSILDRILAYECHEVVHARDFSNPLKSISKPNDLYRIALEDLASLNTSFYKEHYTKLLFEARAFTESISMTKELLINKDGISESEAEQRILNAINLDISTDSLFHYKRKNPNFVKGGSFTSSGEYIVGTANEYLDDVSFHSFEELEETMQNFMNKSINHTFDFPKSMTNQIVFFKYEHNPDLDIYALNELNSKISELGFTLDFYKSLSVLDKIKLNITIYKEYFDDYKLIDPTAQSLEERIKYWRDLGIIDPKEFDLHYFEEKLIVFQDKQFLKDRIKEFNSKALQLKQSYWLLSTEDREKISDNFREFFEIRDTELERFRKRDKGQEPSLGDKF